MNDEKKALNVKLTEEQRRLLDEAAAERGLATSTWVRALALEAARAPAANRALLRETLEQALQPTKA